MLLSLLLAFSEFTEIFEAAKAVSWPGALVLSVLILAVAWGFVSFVRALTKD